MKKKKEVVKLPSEMTKKELKDLVKWGQKEIAEWERFVKEIKKDLASRKDKKLCQKKKKK